VIWIGLTRVSLDTKEFISQHLS